LDITMARLAKDFKLIWAEIGSNASRDRGCSNGKLASSWSETGIRCEFTGFPQCKLVTAGTDKGRRPWHHNPIIQGDAMKTTFQLSATLLACVTWAGMAQAALDAVAQPAIVGEAAMVIGVARITSSTGDSAAVNRGTAIRVGDRIETESGGHVHVRFVDGGRLSVRPSSRLQVENYSHAAQQPALTAIKFRLDEGVVRSITGSWGEASRDRFRLNTPVAAIGIKGTDFVVRADNNSTAASVYTGAIVLAALSGGCQTSLGPCQNGGEKLLSQDMPGQMLELGRGQAGPQLVPLVDLLAENSRRAAGGQLAKVDKSSTADTSRAPSSGNAGTAGAAVPVATETGVTVSALLPNVKPEAVATPVVPDAPLPVVSQLAWARYSWATAVEGDALSKSFEAARENGRQLTAGNGSYGLFRNPSADGVDTLLTADASATFRLAGSSAQLVKSSGATEAATVDHGSLSIDFTRRTFDTQLAVSSATVGTDQIAASGAVAADGLFLSTAGNAWVAGATSLNGKEAGYIFEKQNTSGTLRGLTLWGR
jgi:hypothetical protein